MVTAREKAMKTGDARIEVGQVDCEICLKEVPPAGKVTAETSDYVVYFCGLDCYQQWKERMRADADAEDIPGAGS
jgi:hypothetical protein